MSSQFQLVNAQLTGQSARENRHQWFSCIRWRTLRCNSVESLRTCQQHRCQRSRSMFRSGPQPQKKRCINHDQAKTTVKISAVVMVHDFPRTKKKIRKPLSIQTNENVDYQCNVR